MQENKIPVRIVVHTKDVENMTGFSARTAARLLQMLRQVLGKPKGGFITAREFASYHGIEEAEVIKFLR